MDEIVFTAQEYQKDQSLRMVEYRYRGSLDTGWEIEREGEAWLQLGPGFVAVKSLYCGICSTDLARHRLPFSLPQITGHELVGEYQAEVVAVEINASHTARAVAGHTCEYCHCGLDIHCPARLTLGIDRLPGGFAPWLLAPVNAIHPLPASIPPLAGVLIEPFAAAIKAVELTPPATGDTVAVLGPRRLGMLIIAALDSHRKLHQKQFEIIALMRHPALKATALELGANEVVVLPPDRQGDSVEKFDIVFDTTGSPAGFERALLMAKQVVHLKSTHGESVLGLNNLTTMVINEQVIIAYSEQRLSQLLVTDIGMSSTKMLYVSPLLTNNDAIARLAGICEVVTDIEAINLGHELPQQFDFAIVSSISELNKLSRAITQQGQNLLKPTGTVMLASTTASADKSTLFDYLNRTQLQIMTSRCGSFTKTIDILRQLPELAKKLQEQLITQTMDITQLPEAMRLAGQSDKSIKVVVKTG